MLKNMKIKSQIYLLALMAISMVVLDDLHLTTVYNLVQDIAGDLADNQCKENQASEHGYKHCQPSYRGYGLSRLAKEHHHGGEQCFIKRNILCHREHDGRDNQRDNDSQADLGLI